MIRWFSGAAARSSTCSPPTASRSCRPRYHRCARCRGRCRLAAHAPRPAPSVTFVTGHAETLDWRTLAAPTAPSSSTWACGRCRVSLRRCVPRVQPARVRRRLLSARHFPGSACCADGSPTSRARPARACGGPRAPHRRAGGGIAGAAGPCVPEAGACEGRRGLHRRDGQYAAHPARRSEQTGSRSARRSRPRGLGQGSGRARHHADAERRGEVLPPGGTVVEGTAGNTRYRAGGRRPRWRAATAACVIVMPDNQSPRSTPSSRCRSRCQGAHRALASEHYQKVAAAARASCPHAIWSNQFDNTANRETHLKTTGPEIWSKPSDVSMRSWPRPAPAAPSPACRTTSSPAAARVVACWPTRRERALRVRPYWHGQGDRQRLDHRGYRHRPSDRQSPRRTHRRRRTHRGRRNRRVCLPPAARGGLPRAPPASMSRRRYAWRASSVLATVVTVLCDGGSKYRPRLRREWLMHKGLSQYAPAAPAGDLDRHQRRPV